MALIERDTALRALLTAVEAVRRGSGRCALVYGEAGIGKTSLVTQFVASCAGVRVWWGGCEALFSPRPLGPLYDMAGGFSASLRAMLGREGRRAELFAALLAELQEAALPTLLVFEDMHWADAATLDLVKYLARRIHRAPALLLLTYRDDELGERHPLRGVLGDLPADTLTRVPLLPLSEAGVGELARRAQRSGAGLYAATGGNPFFVTEALGAEGLPATVRDAVLARAARQPASVRALLDLAAIVPARIEATLVDAILAPQPNDIALALASGLLVADGRSYAFRHELARIAVEQALPAPLAAALHAKVLACLEQADDPRVPMARRVHHAAGANNAAAVLRYAPQAAAQAAAHSAHREAASLLATALAHSAGLEPAARAELLEQRAYQCYLTDQIEHAIAARRSALAIWRQLGCVEQEGRTLRWLSRLHWFIGANREAETLADQAVSLLQGLPIGRELAWAYSNRAQLHALASRSAEAVAWGTRAIELATTLGDAEVLSHALNNVGTARYRDGDREGRAQLERSLALALEHGYSEHAARAYVNLASVAVHARDYAAARRTIDEASAYFAARDLDSWSNYVLSWQSRLDLEQGHFDAAAAAAGRLATNAAVAPVTRISALAVLARVRQRRGDPGATELLDEATALATSTGELQRIAPVAAARAEAAWLDRRHSASEPLLTQCATLARDCRDPRALGELQDWAQRLGAAIAAPAAGDVEPPYALQFAGDWGRAAAAWSALGCPYERALALLAGDEAACNEALAALEGLGAAAVARRCREQLRTQGMRGIARGPRASTAENPKGLTAREVQILQLLAEGLTNAEIASRIVRSEKTVDHHISAILRKLEVRSRVEAAVRARELGVNGQA